MEKVRGRKNMYFGATTFVLSFFVLNVFSAEKCNLPNHEDAPCVPILSCTALHKALITLQPEAFELVKKHQCGPGSPGREALVCCRDLAPKTPTTTPAPPPISKMDLLPSRRYCGYQRFDDYYHTDDDVTVPSIDEFPWLAALVYDTPSSKGDIFCTGTLISNRYVLTLAGCLRTQYFTLAGVRLGEYNIDKEDDCIKSGQYDSECTEPITTFGAEEIIRHPNHARNDKEYDIGLIRLNQTVTYNDFVRPICLPFPGTKFAKAGDTVYESGWGNGDYNTTVDVKNKVPLKLLSNVECSKHFYGERISDFQMCTNQSSTDPKSCGTTGGGGPLMFFNRNQWHQEGIVWLGSCGVHATTINIKVAKHLDWILENIRP